jgi:hypothetical protein
MRDLTITDGDLVFDGRDFATIDGVDSIVQAVRLALATFSGECAFDAALGSRWHDLLGQVPANPRAFEIEARRIVLSVPGISSVASVATSVDTTRRSASIAVIAVSDTGEIVSATVEVA